MIPAGLLPAMSADFGVSASAIGLMVSLWAVTIIVASLPVVRLTARVDRRTLIVVALAVMAVANALTAIAPTYEFALGARVVAAVAHGAFWSVVMVYATSLVAPSAAGRTVAIVSAGASGATVAGIPLGTVIGQVADWRLVFGGLALVLGLVAVVIRLRLPASPGVPPTTAGRRVDRSIRPVLAAAVACTLTAAASFTLFTYISPYLTDVAGFPAEWVGLLLLGFGIAGIAGLVIAATTADRWPVSSLVAMTTAFAIALATLGIVPQSTPGRGSASRLGTRDRRPACHAPGQDAGRRLTRAARHSERAHGRLLQRRDRTRRDARRGVRRRREPRHGGVRGCRARGLLAIVAVVASRVLAGR